MKRRENKVMTSRFSDKWFRIALHILVWTILIVLPYIVNSNRGRPPRLLTDFEENQFIKLNFLNYVLWISCFYLNSLVLMPLFFYTKRYAVYIGAILMSFLLAVIVHSLFFKVLLPDLDFHFVRSVWANSPSFLLTIAASIAFTMMSDRNEAERKNFQREQEHMRTEVSFLRSQISPHFIFNVLNNVVALVRLKSDELEPTVIKLSGLMQYMLYDTDDEKVSLETEMEYLQAYIDLQQQRFGGKVAIETNFQINNTAIEIEPMLLIPFIENAFKHGVGIIENPQIVIDLKVDDHCLAFKVENKFNPLENEIKDNASGIGLANVTRRLNLLYGNNHQLKIQQENGWFVVDLTLKLAK